jgi:hypothetical protein
MKKTNNVIGLDIGTSRLVSARKQEEDFLFQSQLNAFLPLPFSRMTESILKKENVTHNSENGELVVYGRDCERFANLFRLETRRPMTRGLLNPEETSGLPVMRQIVASLVGSQWQANNLDRGSVRKICFSVPGAPVGSPDDLTYHEATIRRVLTDMGFHATSINEGLAVVLAELEDNNFTGIGISCGGGMCNVCLSYLAMPVFSFSVPKGGDFIDSSAASVSGEGPTQVRAIKEKAFHFNGFFQDKVHQAISVYYEDMIQAVTSALKDFLSKAKNVPQLDRPVPVVVSGGSAMPAGFRDRFEKIFRTVELPIRISEIRLAQDPLNATAKGALLSALAED